MMVIYEEKLPKSYLLVLAPGTECPGTALAPSIHRACCSGRPAVWVDCRLLDVASASEADAILACETIARQHHAQLVLGRVSEVLEQELRRRGSCARIVASLQDA